MVGANEEVIAWLRLSGAKGILKTEVLEFFRSCKSAVKTLEVVCEHYQYKPNFYIPDEGYALDQIKLSDAIGGQILPFGSDKFPEKLRVIASPPFVLYTLGDIKLLSEKFIVSIVGARLALPESLKFAYNLAYEFGEYGVRTCSGFAKGVDTEVCKGSLKFGTIQVLASGLDLVYPASNKVLFTKVLENGGLFLSEQPFGMPSSFFKNKQSVTYFPKRNRIISGLSDAVVIVQAKLNESLNKTGSGTLNTAKHAMSQGKKVFAVPSHPSQEQMSGCNELIKQNLATPIFNTRDVISFLEHKYKTTLKLCAGVPRQKESSYILSQDQSLVMSYI